MMMFKKIARILFLFLVSGNIYSQGLFSSMEEGTLIFKDGTQKDGLIKIVGNTVKYRISKEDEKIKYDHTELYRVFFKDPERTDFLYEFVSLKLYNNPQLLKVEIDNNLSLYCNNVSSYSGPAGGFSGGAVGMSMGGGMGMSVGGANSTTVYYIKKKDELVATTLVVYGSFPTKSFKKTVRSYFTDCPELIEKVNKKEFRKKHFMEIVDFYNENCSKVE